MKAIKVQFKTLGKRYYFGTAGLKLEQGSHTIEFKYVPRGFKSGVTISIISILLLIFLKKRK